MEHLDELVVDGSQGHGPRCVETVTGGQDPGGARQGHDTVSSATGEPEALKALTHSGGLEAARSQGDDEAPGLGALQEPFSG